MFKLKKWHKGFCKIIPKDIVDREKSSFPIFLSTEDSVLLHPSELFYFLYVLSSPQQYLEEKPVVSAAILPSVEHTKSYEQMAGSIELHVSILKHPLHEILTEMGDSGLGRTLNLFRNCLCQRRQENNDRNSCQR